MIGNIRKISNPLTIIAIFAGFAEISGTVVLPFLESSSQETYLWFLMGFPLLLILLFFATLNFNYRVLYAPSDFKDEDNFLRLFGKPTAEELIRKLNSEIEQAEEQSSQSQSGTTLKDVKVELDYREVIRRNSASTHYFAEELVMTKLAQEFDEVEKEVMLRAGSSQFLFDGVAKKGKKIFAIEVKYLKDRSSLKNIRSSLVKISKTLSNLPSEAEPMTVLLAIATDLEGEEMELLEREINTSKQSVNFNCEVRVFNLATLESELLHF